MIERHDSQVDLAELARELETLRYTLDGSGTYMANWQSSGPTTQMLCCPTLVGALAEISQIRRSGWLYVMVNKIPPGIRVPEHTDSLVGYKRHERWHLPVVTSDGARSWWAGEELTMTLGSWWGPVPFWFPHRVQNLGLHDRVHVVVDLCQVVP